MIDLKQSISEALKDAQSPALLCSFGSDSTLLLHFARQVNPNIAVYHFGDSLPALAQQLVVEDDLVIHSFAPVDRYLVPSGEQLNLIEEYSFNGVRVPMVSKVRSGIRETCAVERWSIQTSEFHFPHDLVLWGYRYEDSDPLLPDVKFEREIQLGHTKFVAPLYDLTTDQVWNALDALGLSYVEQDEAQLCDKCLNTIINSDWNKQAALAGFRARFNLDN